MPPRSAYILAAGSLLFLLCTQPFLSKNDGIVAAQQLAASVSRGGDSSPQSISLSTMKWHGPDKIDSTAWHQRLDASVKLASEHSNGGERMQTLDLSNRNRELLGRRPPRGRQTAPRPSARRTSPHLSSSAHLLCPKNCSSRPSCHRVRAGSRIFSYCLCQPGWSGEACERRDASPCNTPDGGRVLSRCAGTCDEDVNRCSCGDSSRYPDRPMRACYYDGVEDRMPWLTPSWGGFAHGPRSHFWGYNISSGEQQSIGAWCDVSAGIKQRPLQQCSCYDGADGGPMCAPTMAFCVNQCGGEERGHCQNGYCMCRMGYMGIDCSIRDVEIEQGAADVGFGGVAHGSGNLKGHNSRDDAHSSRPSAPSIGLAPRVYVYEVPPDYNMLLLARRLVPEACALRTYGKGNGPAWSSNLYGAEIALHEALLSSPHRTLDPERAHYFYVPVYVGCFVSEFNRPYPRHWLCDECHRGKPADLASLRALRWQRRLLHWIRGVMPFWNRSSGSDHMWPAFHDEGACYAPVELQQAIILTHWGRRHTRPNGSSEYHLWRVWPHAKEMYGWTRCYDPCKDIVLPSWRRPEVRGRGSSAASNTTPTRLVQMYWAHCIALRAAYLQNRTHRKPPPDAGDTLLHISPFCTGRSS